MNELFLQEWLDQYNLLFDPNTKLSEFKSIERKLLKICKDYNYEDAKFEVVVQDGKVYFKPFNQFSELLIYMIMNEIEFVNKEEIQDNIIEEIVEEETIDNNVIKNNDKNNPCNNCKKVDCRPDDCKRFLQYHNTMDELCDRIIDMSEELYKIKNNTQKAKSNITDEDKEKILARLLDLWKATNKSLPEMLENFAGYCVEIIGIDIIDMSDYEYIYTFEGYCKGGQNEN